MNDAEQKIREEYSKLMDAKVALEKDYDFMGRELALAHKQIAFLERQADKQLDRFAEILARLAKERD